MSRVGLARPGSVGYVARPTRSAWSALSPIARMNEPTTTSPAPDPAKLSNTLTIDGSGPFRLDFIMADYVEHLKHHLKAVLPEAGLESRFENVYGG